MLLVKSDLVVIARKKVQQPVKNVKIKQSNKHVMN